MLALWFMAWCPLILKFHLLREHFVRKRYATSPIQLIVNVISGTFEFFMLVGREPSLTNLHASLINDPHHHHINHQTVYIVATGCLKTLKRVHAWNTKTLAAFTSSPKTNIVCSFLETGKKNINVVKFTISSSKIFISVQSILNRFTSALVNNVEGKIMVLWGQNRRKTTQWLCDKFETSQRREIIDDK